MTWAQSQCLQLIFSKREVFLLHFEQPQCSIFETLMPLRQREAEKAPGTMMLLQSLSCYSHNAIAEIALEGLRLVSLHLPVLHGVSPERSVQLGDVHGRGTLLILRWILANPIMQIHSRATRCSFALEEARKMRAKSRYLEQIMLLGKGRWDGALWCSKGARPGARDLIQENGAYVYILLKQVAVIYIFMTRAIKENWATLEVQNSVCLTCPTFVEFDIKT